VKYRELAIQTLRTSPADARTAAAGLLARAGYVSRDGEPTALGDRALERLGRLAATSVDFLGQMGLEILQGEGPGVIYDCADGDVETLHCPKCNYTADAELAGYKRLPSQGDAALPLEKIATPDCSTIAALATFLGVPRRKTAKALMYVRPADGQFVFVVATGDRQISERKLRRLVGNLEPASAAQIDNAGAVAGYASPVGLREALVVADEQIPLSANLVGGANVAGYHLQNLNYGRDFAASVVGDLTLASPGDPCPNCGRPLVESRGYLLADESGFQFRAILLALADKCHDARGLCLPAMAAPFDVHLLHLSSKEMDTAGRAEELYDDLEAADLPVLYDDREERAGVKFNDADLIGLPLRVTVGAKGLESGMIELKARTSDQTQLVALQVAVQAIRAQIPRP
jgi:prolyl-tRNA synthetase